MKEPVEIVNLRTTVYTPARDFSLSNCLIENGSNNFSETEGKYSDIRKGLLHKEKLKEGNTINGPAVISQYASTTYVASGWQGHFDVKGNLILTLNSAG